MRNIRYIIRLSQAFLNRFKGLIVIGVAIGFIVFIVLNLLIPSFLAETVKIGTTGRYTPDSLPNEISDKISAGLTKVDPDGSVLPAIAKSWETNDGGKTWIFTLRDDLVWQDGKKLTSNDIKYEFSDASYEDIDDYHIKFNLESKFSAFPVILSKPVFKKGFLGVGEWKVKKTSLNGGYLQEVTLVNKNGNKMIYRFYPSEDRTKLAFKLGEIDIASNLSDPTPFDTWKNTLVNQEVSYNNFVALFFNTASDKFSDKTVRQAYAYAIDKNSFTGERALGPISPLSWAYNPQVKQYLKDDEKAKDISGQSIKISALPNLLKTAEIIAKNLESAGVTVEIEAATEVPQDFDLFLATVDIPNDPDQYSLWHSTQTGTNISKLNNARIDKLLEDGRTELDMEERKKIYLDFQRFLVEESPAVFLYHPNFYTISRK